MIRICICGGGSLGHVCAGVMASQDDIIVNILTQHPEMWSEYIDVTDINGKTYSGKLHKVDSSPSVVLQDCDLILLCLPGFAIESTLLKIKPYIGNAVVGSIVCSTGFFFAAHKILGENARLFGFQRVPYIARTSEYGHSANLLGYKTQLAIAVENVDDAEKIRTTIEKMWMTPTKLLATHYEASLTNSNPILHTARLFSMWKDWNGEKYDHNILFYKEWTNEASEQLIKMDEEFMRLIDVLPVTKGAIPALLKYYECYDVESLTCKIKSIKAFQNITSPMEKVNDGWIPDFNSRYFSEDFPYGLKLIVKLAHEYNVEIPISEKVLKWGLSKLHKDS